MKNKHNALIKQMSWVVGNVSIWVRTRLCRAQPISQNEGGIM